MKSFDRLTPAIEKHMLDRTEEVSNFVTQFKNRRPASWNKFCHDIHSAALGRQANFLPLTSPINFLSKSIIMPLVIPEDTVDNEENLKEVDSIDEDSMREWEGFEEEADSNNEDSESEWEGFEEEVDNNNEDAENEGEGSEEDSDDGDSENEAEGSEEDIDSDNEDE